MVAPQAVSLDQRHTRSHPCPICGGYSAQPQGKGIRCAGFRSADNDYEHCQREQYAGDLPLDESTTPPTFAHWMRGECRCGVTHGPTTYGPRRQTTTKRIVHVLREADGAAVGDHVRLLLLDDIDSETGKLKKRGPWWENHGGRAAADMPLYGLPRLAKARPDTRIWVVEGEPAQEALQAALDAVNRADVVVGTVTGAPAIPCDASLQPLVGYPSALWSDNDNVGRQQMERIAARLVALGAEPPKWVNWKDAPPKGDAADFFAAGGTIEQLESLVADRRHAEEREETDTTPDERLSTWEGGTLLSEVTPVSIEWLWGGYVPLGKLTMGDGDPGLGKTMLYAADLAARVTTGNVMPDGTPGIAGGAGVVLFTAEDDPADTLQPRLVAAGGDLTRVVVVTTIQRPDPNSDTGAMSERLPTFADLDFIERKIEQVHAKLVIFDPFMAYLPSAVNSFRDQDIRSALAPLARLAQKTGAAFVLIRHLNKGSFANALYRGGGSIGIIGAARSGLLVVKHPNDENLRIFGSMKSNLGPPMAAWKYRIAENESGVPCICWEGQSEQSASDVLNLSSDRDTTSKLEAACELLRVALKDEAQAEERLKEEAKAQGISLATLRRAKKMLGVESEKVGIGTMGYWLWTLPDKGAQDEGKGAHTSGDERLKGNPGYNASQQADSAKDAQVDGDERLWADDEHVSGDEEGDEWKF
jgi:hypothetical protein